MIVGSSGKLTAQIQMGAPFDVLVSANMKYPNSLQQKNLTTIPPTIYAYGQLVLWTMDSEKKNKPSLEILSDATVSRIAIANPKIAPYGEAAKEVLMHIGLYSTLADKLVYGESIAQTNQFILSRAADIGFTSKSVVVSPQMQGKGSWVAIPDSLYTPIAQGIAVIKRDPEKKEAALQFYHFLFSDDAQALLNSYGYKSVK